MEDADAVARVLAGDRDAYAELVRRYHRPLYYFVVGRLPDDAEAEDVVQKTLVTAYHRLRDYDASRPLLAWLRGIALNHCRNELRQSERQALLRERFVDARRAALQAELVEEEGDAADDRRVRALRTCVDGLGEREREVLRLRFVEERPLGEVGGAVSRNAEAVRLFLFRLRGRLADCVRRRLAEEGAP
jgi:RNA polymerase sigma-70 factor (ECF subfamily)